MSQRYSEAFKEQAISKVLQRSDKTIQCIADELNVNLFTLKNWLKKPRTTPMTDTPMNKRPADWSMAERFALLMESAALEGVFFRIILIVGKRSLLRKPIKQNNQGNPDQTDLYGMRLNNWKKN